MNDFWDFWEAILTKYSEGEYLETLLKAKADYIALTGMIDEEAEDYEGRMKSFNDWYLTSYKLPSHNRTPLEHYLFTHTDLDQELVKAIESITYSIFLYKKVTWSKQIVLKDLISKNKTSLYKEHSPLNIVKKEYFIGRLAVYKEQPFILEGIVLLPEKCIPILKGHYKRIRKNGDIEERQKFLLKTEALNNKWKQYGHVEPKKIFIYEF